MKCEQAKKIFAIIRTMPLCPPSHHHGTERPLFPYRCEQNVSWVTQFLAVGVDFGAMWTHFQQLHKNPKTQKGPSEPTTPLRHHPICANRLTFCTTIQSHNCLNSPHPLEPHRAKKCLLMCAHKKLHLLVIVPIIISTAVVDRATFVLSDNRFQICFSCHHSDSSSSISPHSPFQTTPPHPLFFFLSKHLKKNNKPTHQQQSSPCSSHKIL